MTPNSKKILAWGSGLTLILVGTISWIYASRRSTDRLIEVSSASESRTTTTVSAKRVSSTKRIRDASVESRSTESRSRLLLPMAFTVRVQDKEGKPIAGAEVAIWSASGTKIQAKTDFTGVFSLPQQPAYPGTLRVSYPGLTPHARKLVAQKSSYLVTLFNRRTLRGRVVDENDNGLPAVQLELSPEYSNEHSGPEAEIRTQADGYFRFEGLAKESYRIQVSSDSHAPLNGAWLSYRTNESRFLTIRMKRIQAVVLAYETPMGLPVPEVRNLKMGDSWSSPEWMFFQQLWMAKRLLRGIEYKDCEIGWADNARRSARVTIEIRGYEKIVRDVEISTFGKDGEIRVNTCVLRPLAGWRRLKLVLNDQDNKRPVDGIVPVSITTLKGKGVIGYLLEFKDGVGSIMLPNGKFRFRFGSGGRASFRNRFKREVTQEQDTLKFNISIGGRLKITTKIKDSGRWVKIRRFNRTNQPLFGFNWNGQRASFDDPIVLQWMQPGDYALRLIDQDGMTTDKSIRIELGKITIVEF